MADYIQPPTSMPNNQVQYQSSQSVLPRSSIVSNDLSTGFLGTLGNVLNGIPVFGPLLSGVISTITQSRQNEKNRQFELEQAQNEREWNEQMMDKQNQFSLDMWNRTNEYNSPLQQIQRLRDAGLNPLYYGLDGSSASSFQSAQPLGYDRASVGNQINPFSVGLDSSLQAKSLQKDIELKNAQIDQMSANIEGIKLDNEFKEKTMNARTLATELANSLTRKQIKEIDKKMDVMEEDVKLKIAQTDNEIEKKALIQAEKILAHAQAAEIVYLLPYRQNLLAAQTEAQKAAASASYIHALYEKGLIDGGYLDSLCTEAENRAKASEYDVETSKHRARQTSHDADIERFKSSVRNGTLFSGNDWWSRAGNDIFGALSALSEALGGSLVPLLSAGIIGSGVSKAGSTINVPTGADASTVAKQTAALGK